MVTLSLMILLTIMAVGLLSLSSIAFRTTSQASAAATARNNARLAMMMALSELQVVLGPDQGVSAPAGAIFKNTSQPHLTGAWKGWHWIPSKTGAPSYSEKEDQFARWLVSTADPDDAEEIDLASGSPPSGPDSIQLVGEATDSQGDPTEVIVEKVPVTNGKQSGKLAWAVFDESTKAAIDIGDSVNPEVDTLEVASRKAPDRFRADALDVSLDSLKTPTNLVSLDTAVIPGGTSMKASIRQRFHDFTTGSLGLLTDTAYGGLKKDLTQAFGASRLPRSAFERITPYPEEFGDDDGSPTWEFLYGFHNKYQNVTLSGGTPAFDLTHSSRYAKRNDLKYKRIGSGGRDTGVDPQPDFERLLPVIAKLQLVFSLVSHWSYNVDNRRAHLNSNGDPKGYQNYGAINLVYDPVVTLYNPYDIALDLSMTRIRIWDPPVAFRFRKYDNRTGAVSDFRQGGEFVSLGKLQIGYANNPQYPDPRKCFTLVLADGTSEGLDSSLRLEPGEVKVFGIRVEQKWNWGYETSGGYAQGQGTFFDWEKAKNFGNQDNRATVNRSINRGGLFGVECAPGWDPRAGLQCDHLADPRDPASRYSFEQDAGFVTIRLTDDVEVEVKPQVVSGDSSAQFQVDVLAGLDRGNTTDVNRDRYNAALLTDTLRSYRFNFASVDPKEEISENPDNEVIGRKFNVGDILQDDDAPGRAGKKPFAMLEMSARTTKDHLTDNKPWLYNNFVVEGGVQDSSQVGLPNQAYDLRLIEMTSFDSFPGGIDIDPDTYRGYFGASGSITEGSSFVNMMHVPLAPPASLGEFIHGNLVNSALLPRVVHPFGNARAHPLISTGSVAEGDLLDHSYLLNDALWDSCFLSSITDYGLGLVTENRSLDRVLTGVLDGTRPAFNSRMVPVTSPGDTEDLAREIDGLGEVERSRQMAKYLGVDGPFNVNSVSVDAWRAVLMSLRDRVVQGLELTNPPAYDRVGQKAYDMDGVTPFVRAGKPIAGPNVTSSLRWAAFRTLTDGEITELAESIVEEIKNRGEQDKAPSMTLGEFVNRRIESGSGLHVLAGLLQTAIDNTDINDNSHKIDSKSLNAGSITGVRKAGVKTETVMNGDSAEGAPTMITQGDLMEVLAPIATVRGDTFKIRAYGEATAADGDTVTARAWCEAVVQRVPEFVDPVDEPETEFDNLSETNKTFGRRFTLVSFRWLNQEEL